MDLHQWRSMKLLIPALILLAACGPQLPFECSIDSQCGVGLRCQASQCVSAATATPPPSSTVPVQQSVVNDTCETATVASVGVTRGTTRGAKRDYSPMDCYQPDGNKVPTGGEVVFRFRPPQYSNLKFSVRSLSQDFTPAFYLTQSLPTCAQAIESKNCSANPLAQTYVDTPELFVLVGSTTATEGDFELTIEATSVQANQGGGSAGAGSTAGGAVGGGTPPPQATATPLDDLASASHVGRPSFAVDGAGVRHVAFMRSGQVRYGRCAGNCGQRSNWRFLNVPNAPGREVSMAVSATGKVGLVWASRTPDRFGYSECSASDCSNPSSWASLTMTASFPRLISNAIFDGNGVFHVVLDQTTTDDQLLSCSANCTNSQAAWFASRTGFSCVGASLALNSGGEMGIACVGDSQNVTFSSVSVARTNGVLSGSFSQSIATIANDAAWAGAGVDLKYANGQPRLTFTTAGRVTRLAWCSASCALSASWASMQFNNNNSLPWPRSAIALSASDVPTLIYVEGDALVARRCTSGSCYSLMGSYSQYTADTNLQAYSPQRFPLPTNCQPNETPFASSVTGEISRALDVGGRTEIITVASDVGGCNVTSGIETNWHLRYAVVP